MTTTKSPGMSSHGSANTVFTFCAAFNNVP